MNFNYLLDEKRMKVICKGSVKGECHWSPTGRIRATVGDNINVSMFCKRCGCKEDIFLSEQEYRIQNKILGNEVGDV
tara:strand:+ start:1893 stop:2123 length:231 start_codon:yes stop_codon:yes gene_type:complete